MPLSLNKLASFLFKKDFIPRKYFRFEGNCIFLEMVSLSSGVTTMLYIPSRFVIPLSPGENVIEVELIDTEDMDPNAYDRNPLSNPEDTYQPIDVIPSNDHGNTEEMLQLKYKKAIELKSGKTKNTNVLKEIIRQLNRLQYCVEGLPYDITIYQNNYLVYMRNGEPDCYVIKEKLYNNARNLRVTTPLQLIYERANTMDHETSQVVKGIQKILDKNMRSHAKFLDQLITRKGNLLNFASLMNRKKMEYDQLINKYKGLLEKLDLQEKDIKLRRKKFADLGGGGFDSELNRSQVRAGFERKLQHCLVVKQKIIDKMIVIQSASESLSLQADKILYDNSIMMDKIFKNFSKLIELSR